MFDKLAARIRRSDIDHRLLIPLLISTTLIQATSTLMRITTSYRAVELNLSVVWVGAIAATFALCPIFIAVWVGRFIDRGNDALAARIGSCLLVLGSIAMVLTSSPPSLVFATAVLGTGHLFLMASQQMLCVRCAEGRNMEAVFGNYMVAGALGQGLGPYIVGFTGGSATLPPTHTLFTIGLAMAGLALAFVMMIPRGKEEAHDVNTAEIVPIAKLLRVPGVVAVIAAGVIVVSAAEIIIIYLPLLGAERGIDVKDIGLLLTIRAGASLVARLFYTRMVQTFGRMPLMINSTYAYAATFCVLAVPLPLWAMMITLAVMGLAFGIATTLSITIVVDMTTAGARGTANSLRIMGNRIGQFGLPLAAGFVAVGAGITGILLMIAAAVAATAASVHWSRPAPDNPSSVS